MEAPRSALVIAFTVPGEPVQWARARGKGAEKYTPAAQKAYARSVGLEAWAAGARAHKAIPAKVPLALGLRVFLAVPPSWKPAEREAALAGRIRPTGKPDLDNWTKLPMDALNGLVWADDAQVVEWLPGSGKFYADRPRLEIEVRLVL